MRRHFLPEWCSVIAHRHLFGALLTFLLLLGDSASAARPTDQELRDNLMVNERGRAEAPSRSDPPHLLLSAAVSSIGQSSDDSYLHSHLQKILKTRDTNDAQNASKTDLETILSDYYESWSGWSPCNRKCLRTRVRRCRGARRCGKAMLKENRPCRRGGGACPPSLSVKDAGLRRRHDFIERVLYDAFYTDWSSWGVCTRSCRQRRRRKCIVRNVCSNVFVQEMRRCSVSGSKCPRRSLLPAYDPLSTWLHAGSSSSFQGVDSAFTHASAMSSMKRVVPTPTLPLSSSSSSSPAAATDIEKDYQPAKAKKLHSEAYGASEIDGVQGVCGLRSGVTRGSYRVVGGQEAQRHSWPWQVAILTRRDEQYCAGTLIAPQWVLTAAHCIQKRGRQRRVVLRVGEHHLKEYENTETEIWPNQADVFPHPHFNYNNITNDIALVRLNRPLKLDSQVGFACLPDAHFTPDPKSLCYILGWGKTRSTHVFGAESLHEAEVPLVSRKRCQRVFEYEITETQLCAGSQRGGTDSCAGDSGGPLLCPKTDSATDTTRWFLMGITSYGEGCGKKGKYGIYTRVQSYLDWIHETVNSNRQS